MHSYLQCNPSSIIILYIAFICLSHLTINMHKELMTTTTIGIGLPVVHGMRRDVMVVGLNPALQRTITIPSIKLGQVHRASDVEVGMHPLDVTYHSNL